METKYSRTSILYMSILAVLIIMTLDMLRVAPLNETCGISAQKVVCSKLNTKNIPNYILGGTLAYVLYALIVPAIYNTGNVSNMQ